ncbi:NorE accessory protein for nitric oxide reductase [Shinella sp. SUS2]|jgi:nitric oxide reductase NorE protein|nr:NorE accessory protein for nitric oxide reductase [Shinella sp. SUS2]KOC76877.1 NorE accessory protein for nitric oxide reductase [Shinella sp. GWS1]
MATMDDMRTAIAETESGEGDCLLLWILVWSELAAFGALLVAFMVLTLVDVGNASLLRAHLHPGLAALNTVLLVLSGWQAALAVRRGADLSGVRRSLVLAGLLGLVFAAVKLTEYGIEVRSGIGAAGTLAELYFLVTGFHLLHVVFGAVVLFLVAWRPSRGNVVMIATLWHAIDLVWLVMFPIVYLT